MIKRLLFSFLFTVAAFAQRTPLKINGAIVDNPNFTNTASLTWAVTGSNIRGTAAGGGDTIWTNDNGTISANSTVANDTDAVAFNANSSNYIGGASSSGNYRLWNIENANTNVWGVNPRGGMYSGVRAGEAALGYTKEQYPGVHASTVRTLDGKGVADFTAQAWYDIPADPTIESALLDIGVFAPTSEGGEDQWTYFVAAATDDAGNQSGFTIEAYRDSADVYIQSPTPQFRVIDDNSKGVTFRPSAGPTTTAHTFDTGVSHSDGYLDEFKNNTTNKAGVLWNGNLTISGQTNQLSVSGGALQIDGVTLLTTTAAANPTASVGLSAVNGSAPTFLRSDGAPALSQSIAPTWTGAHTFAASSGTPVRVTPAANATAVTVNGYSVTGSGTTTGIDLSGTWNTSGNATFIRGYVTNTASGSTSKLIDLGINTSTSEFSVDKSGNLVANGTITANGSGNVMYASGIAIGSGSTYVRLETSADGVGVFKNTATTGFTSLQLGPTDSSPNDASLLGAGASGTDIAGGKVNISGGASTGTGKGGAVIVKTTPSGSTGSSANALSERAHWIPKAVTLTETTATTVATVACASGKFVGGNCVVTVFASDGTDHQARTLTFPFSAINKAGTVTAGFGTPVEGIAASTGTLTATITTVANGNAVDIKVDATSSLTQTTLSATVALPVLNGNDTAAVTEI